MIEQNFPEGTRTCNRYYFVQLSIYLYNPRDISQQNNRKTRDMLSEDVL